MKVSVGTKNPVKVQAVTNVFTRVYETVEVAMVTVESGVPAQPLEQDVVIGAKQRAEQAFLSAGSVNIGVGIESGLFDFSEVLLDVQICSIFDGDLHTIGASPGFNYPKMVLNGVKTGREVGSIMEELSGIGNIGSKMGSIGYLSKGLIDRTHFTELCIIMALIPRINPALYDLP